MVDQKQLQDAIKKTITESTVENNTTSNTQPHNNVKKSKTTNKRNNAIHEKSLLFKNKVTEIKKNK